MNIQRKSQSIFLIALFFSTSSFAMSSLARRLNVGIRPSSIPAVRYISTKEPIIFRETPRLLTAEERQNLIDFAENGIDSKTVKTIKEIQKNLYTINNGCYCGDDKKDTAERQKKLNLISNALKRLAAKTTHQNCCFNREVYKKTK